VNFSDYVLEKVFYIEDKLARLVQQFPRENKQDSFPFLPATPTFSYVVQELTQLPTSKIFNT